MDHLIAGVRNPRVLGQLARARASSKIDELEDTLDDAEFVTAGRAVLLRPCWSASTAQAEIAQLSEVIERLLAPYEEQLQQAESMPGWGRAPPRTRLPRPAST